jgi:Ni,Fe-hydrogenase I small subunit
MENFILVVEGSIPNEHNKDTGYWAALGTDRKTGQPITTGEWIDRLAPQAWAVIAAGTCATYGGIHAMEGNPTGCMGLADYLGWQWKSKAEIPIVCVPGRPVRQCSKDASRPCRHGLAPEQGTEKVNRKQAVLIGYTSSEPPTIPAR